MASKNIVKAAHEEHNPLALIVGQHVLAKDLAKSLTDKGCEVIVDKSYPQYGTFQYIFQFGDCGKVADVVSAHLKKDGKFLFIDCHSEEISAIEKIDKVRIISIDEYNLLDKQELIAKIFRTIFTTGEVKPLDLRSRKITRMAKKKIGDILTSSVEKQAQETYKDITSSTPLPISESALVQRTISKKAVFLFFLILLPLVFVISFASWYVSSLKDTFSKFQLHFASSDWSAVRQDISFARKKLNIAKSGYNVVKFFLYPLQSISIIADTSQLIQSADELLTAGDQAVVLMQDLKTNKIDFSTTEVEFDRDKLTKTSNALDELINSINQTNTTVGNIQLPYFPKEKFISILNTHLQKLTFARQLLPLFEKIFLTEHNKTYLILLQNNMELRATGGFIGSIGLLTVNNGKIIDFKIMDVYDSDGQLKGHVEPPTAIRTHLAQPNWFLRDSNFDPDFAVSALQAQFFLQKELAVSVDGVIGINLFFVQQLLSVLGPVLLPDFNNEVINADNLFFKSQLLVQKDFFEGSTQKKDYLNAVAQQLQKKLNSVDAFPWFEIFTVISESLEKKNILIFFNEQNLNSEIEKLGWSGRMTSIACAAKRQAEFGQSLATDACYADYLAIIESNFGVNKANYFVSKSTAIEKRIDNNGQLQTFVTIAYENKSITDVFSGGPYVNYLRLYAPLGSRLDSAFLNNVQLSLEQFEVSSYGADKTIFATLIKIAPGNKGILKIIYTLLKPFLSQDKTYQFYYQKQPGDKTSPLLLQVSFPKEAALKPANFTSSVSKDNEVFYTSDTSYDRIFMLERVN